MATIVADLGLDEDTVVAALLHDAVEDTWRRLRELETDFNPTVASIVDGVTKLERLDFETKEAQQAATIRKMLVAVAEDLGPGSSSSPTACTTCGRSPPCPGVEAGAHRQGDPDVHAAGPPLRHAEMKQQLEDPPRRTAPRYAEIDHMVSTRAPSASASTRSRGGAPPPRRARHRGRGDGPG